LIRRKRLFLRRKKVKKLRKAKKVKELQVEALGNLLLKELQKVIMKMKNSWKKTLVQWPLPQKV
jgi:molybdopterin synthase catalytic subunit